MSFTILKANIKANRFIWIILTAIFSFYISTLISMFDPDSMEAFAGMLDMMPQELVEALGIKFGTTLVTFLSGVLYTMLIFIFPMILSITVNHRLLASHVEKGSIAYLITTSHSRNKVAVTQAVFSLASITLMFIVITLVGLLVAAVLFPGLMEVGRFILLNVYALLLYYTIGGIGFFVSCLSNESKYSLGLGAGIPIAFVVLQMLGNSGEKLSWIGKLSLLALFDPDRLFAGDAFAYIGMAIFFILAAIFYIGGIMIFNRRDLPI